MPLISKIKWMANRWLAMEHPNEDIYRLNQLVQHYISDKLVKKQKVLAKYANYSFNTFNEYYSKDILESLLNETNNYKVFPLYDFTIEDITKVNNWHGDLKTGISPKTEFCHSIPFQNFEKSGDFRYISVLSRLHHFPFFAALSYLKPEENFEKLIEKQIIEWQEQNPYLYSINWRSGIEVGIRSINLIFTRLFISDENLKIQLDELIILHYNYLINHLSLYSSANNHLLAELSGIFIITAFYQFKGSEKWNKKAFELLIRELFLQTHNDGFSKEQSSHYHAEVINMYLLVLSIAKKKGISLKDGVLAQIGKMGDFLQFLLAEKSLEVIPIGDSDEGELLFPYFDKKYNIYGSILNDVAWLLNDIKYLSTYNRLDARNYFIQGEDGFRQSLISLASNNKKGNTLKTRLFKESGYCFFIENDTKLCFDVGDIGLGKLAAHGHSDLLHFTLDYNGFPFIVDSGTYQYHAHYTFWRNYFRGITAHNTISVNNRDHAQSAGRMIWLQHPKVTNVKFNESDTDIYCEATHNAFLNNERTIHSRKIGYNKLEHSYTIVDILECEEKNSLNFYLHFHPSLQAVHEDTSIILINPNNLRVVLINNYFSEAKLITGDKSMPLGWFSDSFNKKIPSTTLLLEFELQKGKNEIETLISFN